jgi:hypothetical protein
MLEHRSAERRRHRSFTREQTLKWLANLASHLSRDDQATFFIERMQPDWLPPEKHQLFRTCYLTVMTTLLMPGMALTVPLMFGDFRGNNFPWVLWFKQGLYLFGLTAVTLTGFNILIVLLALYISKSTAQQETSFQLDAREDYIRIVEFTRWSWEALFVPLVIGVVVTVGGVLLIGAVFLMLFIASTLGFVDLSPHNRPFHDWIQLFWGFLLAGVGFGLMLGSQAIAGGEVEEKTFPNQGIWRSAKNALCSGFTYALFSGVAIGLAATRLLSWAEGIALGLFFGSIIAFQALWSLGGSACIQHMVLRLMLVRQGDIPYNLVDFLNDAAERNLLRKVGGGYAFIHPLIAEYFTTRKP